MAINTENLYRKIFDNLSSRGFDPIPKNAKTGDDVVPEEADYIEFDFDRDEERTVPVTISVEKKNDRFNLTVYSDDEVTEEGSTAWYKLLNQLRRTSQESGIHGFTLRNKDHFGPDMQKRTYMKKQEQIAEGYYPMGNKASYSDAVPNVKIILQHTRKIEEGEQRYRNIAKIFLENTEGERFLAPTTKPGIARVYGRLIAEGDKPHGERWNHVNSLVEEYQKMGAFVRATRNGQFNESAQRLVNEGINHYQSLRETLGRMTGHRGYNAYFENWTPSLMEDETEESNLNELFVQETLDPRIESVMPILSKLQKNLGEMKEVNELAEWADSLTEAPGAETLSHNQSTEKNNLKAFDLAEEDDLQEPAIDELEEVLDPAQQAALKVQTPAVLRKEKNSDWKVSKQDLAKADEKNMTSPAGMAALKKKLSNVEEEVDLGQYDAVKTPLKGKDTGDWDKNFREKLKQYTKELDQRQKEKSEKVDEDGQFAGDFKTGPEGQWRNKGPKANKPAKVGDLVGASESVESDSSIVEGQEDLEIIKRLLGK